MPVRVQLSRKTGWKMPENTVKVDRSTKWGNPYTIKLCGGRSEAIATHRKIILELYKSNTTIADDFRSDLRKLRGKNLACWCKPGEPCHADVLLELANK